MTSSQVVVGTTDRQNPLKYVIRRTDFRQLPRWPNDGIDQENARPDQEHHETGRSNADQRALTKLYNGHWMCGNPLVDMDAQTKNFVKGLPFQMQVKAARETSDSEAAKQYLIAQYKDYNEQVRDLLRQIHCKSALHKTCRDRTRFPGVRAILYPLFQNKLASVENIELLFGDIHRVLADVLEIGAEFAQPPPPNSPAGALRAQMLQSGKVAAAVIECANCGSQGELVGRQRCDNCKGVNYCSRDCQVADWKLHRPDCFTIRGKEVTKKIKQIAKEEYRKRQAEEEGKMSKTIAAREKLFKDSYLSFVKEPPGTTYSEDCRGKKLPVDLPFSAPFIESMVALTLGLDFETELNLGMFPDGIHFDEYSGRGVLIKDPTTNAKIIVLHERLFANHGNGELNGHHLDGMFVVSKVNKKTNRAVWRKAAKPTYTKDQNRYERFVSYLQKAKEEAKAVPEDVDLGIHNPPQPNMTLQPTEFGDHLSLAF